MDGYLPSSARRDGHKDLGHFTGLRQTLCRIGVQPIAPLGFLVELGWAFVGSLGLGLGVSSSAAGPLQTWAWTGGTLAIAGAAAGAALLALPEKRKEG